MSVMCRVLAGVLVVLLIGTAPAVRADNSTREFVMSCTYGVLAGTLVGAASLAFTKQPSKNMHRVARGASLGLYTGIVLGLYVVYVVPSLEGGDDEAKLNTGSEPPFMISPLFKESMDEWSRGGRQDLLAMDGVQVDWTVLRF